MENNKILPYIDFELSMKFNPKRFFCCKENLVKFGLREEWICKKCKSIYYLRLSKRTQKSLEKENIIEYRDKFLETREIQ